MKVNHELRYDAKPAAVYTMLTDPSFRERVCDRSRAIDWNVDVVETSGGTQVTVERSHAAPNLPGFARKFVGDSIRIAQVETWSNETTATLQLTIPGKPGRLVGTSELTTDGDGTLQTISGTLKVGVPLIGGKLEELVDGFLRKALRAEQRVGADWLADAG
ncbi:DUF2505 domain-containing protein [Solicola gregarius]|uniref:DUF2505 domain-containing protein n=1 Tax=Solicola gregarius TaxID=2908642 RepID=A0AA46TE41_9ACTN|nr:DUF2505 domain-containing protein [Solicola gregarius]UYM03425.1 DUF2505 domain-containing protein [Solicola gregarius]